MQVRCNQPSRGLRPSWVGRGIKELEKYQPTVSSCFLIIYIVLLGRLNRLSLQCVHSRLHTSVLGLFWGKQSNGSSCLSSTGASWYIFPLLYWSKFVPCVRLLSWPAQIKMMLSFLQTMGHGWQILNDHHSCGLHACGHTQCVKLSMRL